MIAIHVVFQALLSTQTQGLTVLFTLPEIPLPEGVGIKLGGEVTLEAVLNAVYFGLQLAAIFCCIGAANALGSARRLLRYMPAALYEIGIAAVIALTFAPQLVTDAGRVRSAARLRGSGRGIRQFGRLSMPILEGALERSVDLAAAMDARGYGRTTNESPSARRVTAGLVLLGSFGLLVGVYGLLTAHGFGTPLLLAGAALGIVGLRLGGRRTGRTRYRPDPWALPELIVVASGVVAAALMFWTSSRSPELLFLASPTQSPPVPLARLCRHPGRAGTRVPRSAGARPRRSGAMIRFESVTVTYAEAETPALAGVDLHVPEGELVLVMGSTGSGKTTLLRSIIGLVPHFSGGTLRGRVLVDGRDTATHPPRDLADVVGFVGQDPVAGFVTDNVEDELAYGMESLGLPPATMRKRVEETLDLLGLAGLRGRPLANLSGGQQQRVAIGSVLTTHPRILVLDEPTSALDPLAAEDVLSTLQRLVHDLGLTVVLAEHRLERVVQHADRIVWIPGNGGRVIDGDPATILAGTPIAPPVVELGRAAGWSPLPLTVRDARRLSADLRARLDGVPPPEHRAPTLGEAVAEAKDLVAGYGKRIVVNGVDLAVRQGEVVALMGRNGAGKSTLLRSLVGLHQPRSGKVTVGRAGLVPQVPADILYAATVTDECGTSDRDSGQPDGTHPQPVRSARAGCQRRPPSARPVRGPEAHPGAGHRARGQTSTRPPRRADSWARLQRQAPPGRRPP